MNFSKLKLVTEMLASGTGTGLSVSANNKSSEQSQAGKQMNNTSNNIGFQQTQMSTKPGTAPKISNVVQKNVSAPNANPRKTTQQATVEDYFDNLRQKKEYIKSLEENKSDWKTELKEALGKDDEVFHPYVEVMPFKDFKQDEAKRNLKLQAMQDGSADNPAQKMVKGKAMGLGEETIEERVAPPEERKAKKEREAKAAKDAARHMRATKGVPFKDAKGTGYLKNGKKIYEESFSEKK